MKGKSTKLFISLFFISILLFKAAGSLTLIYATTFDEIAISELLVEREQEEKKGNAKSEAGIDELFEKAVLPAEESFALLLNSTMISSDNEPLQDTYPDTLTPPPNSLLS